MFDVVNSYIILHSCILIFQNDFQITFFKNLLFIDINECETGSNDCDVNANCSNSDGSFSCRCKAGFHGDGKVCQGTKQTSCERRVDILHFKRSSHVSEDRFPFPVLLLEIETSSAQRKVTSSKCWKKLDLIAFCHPRSNCLAMETLYFTFSLSIDIDECTANPCDANAACLNTNGSFECTCRPGFDGDGKVCKGKKQVTCERVGDILYFKLSHVCEEHFYIPV